MSPWSSQTCGKVRLMYGLVFVLVLRRLKDTVVALQCVKVWQDVRETEQQIAAVKDAIVMYKNTVTDNESKRDALVAEKETLDAELAVKVCI